METQLLSLLLWKMLEKVGWSGEYTVFWDFLAIARSKYAMNLNKSEGIFKWPELLGYKTLISIAFYKSLCISWLAVKGKDKSNTSRTYEMVPAVRAEDIFLACQAPVQVRIKNIHEEWKGRSKINVCLFWKYDMSQYFRKELECRNWVCKKISERNFFVKKFFNRQF